MPTAVHSLQYFGKNTFRIPQNMHNKKRFNLKVKNVIIDIIQTLINIINII